MSNSSLQEQLQAVASKLGQDVKPKKVARPTRSESKSPTARPVSRTTSSTRPSPTSKPTWLQQAQYGVELLRAYFPSAFPEGTVVKPLKIGIKQDLVKHLSTLTDVTLEDKACMVKSLAYYVNTLHYLKAMQPEAIRVDLNGQEVGKVTAEEATYSKQRHQSRVDAKKAAKAGTPRLASDVKEPTSISS